MRTVSFVQHRIVSAVKRVEFLGARMSYIVLRGRWCNVVVLNTHAPIEDKSDDTKDSLGKELQQVFHHFLIYHTKFCLDILKQNLGKRILSNRQFGMTVSIRILMIMVLE